MNETEGRMAEHWKHRKFVQNLLVASYNCDPANPAKAAEEWEFEWYNAPSKGICRCHLCNAAMKSFVILRNKKNDNLIAIGLDCYDKFNALLKTGNVASQSADRSTSVNHRRYLRSIIPDKTIFGWLKQQLELGKLPKDIAPIVIAIIHRGMAFQEADADKLVDFYKKTRKFPASELIPHVSDDVREEITIADVPRILEMIDNGKRAIENTDEKERRDNWKQDRLRAIYLFGVLQRLIDEVKFRLARGAKDEGYIGSFALFAERKVKEFKYFVENMPSDCPERSSPFAFTPRGACSTFTPLITEIRKYLSRVS